MERLITKEDTTATCGEVSGVQIRPQIMRPRIHVRGSLRWKLVTELN